MKQIFIIGDIVESGLRGKVIDVYPVCAETELGQQFFPHSEDTKLISRWGVSVGDRFVPQGIVSSLLGMKDSLQINFSNAESITILQDRSIKEPRVYGLEEAIKQLLKGKWIKHTSLKEIVRDCYELVQIQNLSKISELNSWIVFEPSPSALSNSQLLNEFGGIPEGQNFFSAEAIKKEIFRRMGENKNQ